METCKCGDEAVYEVRMKIIKRKGNEVVQYRDVKLHLCDTCFLDFKMHTELL